MFGAGTDRREIALQIDREDDVEILLAHLGDAARADDAGIVDQIIEPAERLDGAVDDRLTARHRRDARGFGDGFAACRHDLVDHLLRETRIGTPALRSATEIVDHDLRSEEHTSELQSLMRISYAVFCLKKKKTR